MARHSEYSVNLAPQPRTIGRAYTDLILAYDWRRVTSEYIWCWVSTSTYLPR